MNFKKRENLEKVTQKKWKTLINSCRTSYKPLEYGSFAPIQEDLAFYCLQF